MSAGASRANDAVVTLKLRSAADVGPQATPAKGPAGEPAIEVAGGGAESTTTLVVCDTPAISSSNYVLHGRVKYDNVEGAGYLELLNDFGGKGTYFSRTLVGSGPMQRLAGTSDWRAFELPFYAEGMKPERLTLNVVLPAAGTVTVAQPLVVGPLDWAGAWWSERQIVLVWIGLTVFFLILAALICASRIWVQSRKLTVTLWAIGLTVSFVLLIAGLVALGTDQPWHVCYQLLLIGTIGIVAAGVSLPNLCGGLKPTSCGG